MDYPESIAEFAKQIFDLLERGDAYANADALLSQERTELDRVDPRLLAKLDLQRLVVATKQLDSYLGRSFDENQRSDQLLLDRFGFDNVQSRWTPKRLRKLVGNFRVTLTHDVEHHGELIISLANWVLADKGVEIRRSLIPVPFPRVLYGLFATQSFAKGGLTYISYGGQDWNLATDRVRAEAYAITLQDTGRREISAYTHFRLNQAGRWANGFPWDASTDAKQRRAFFNNVIFDEQYRENDEYEDIYLRPIVNIEADEEIYAQYGPGYHWETIYLPEVLADLSPTTDKPMRDYVPLSERRELIVDYAANAKVIERVVLAPVPAPAAPAPAPVPVGDLFRLYADAHQQINQPAVFAAPDQELVKWQTASVEGSITRYEQFRRSIPPQLAAAISGYVVQAQDLNESPRLAALIVLANLIDGPYLSAAGRLYADKDYKSKAIITVDNVYFPNFDQVEDRRRTLFSMVNAPYYTVPDKGTKGERDSAVPFNLGEKGIWIKEYAFVPGVFQTAAEFKALRKERTNVQKGESIVPKSKPKKSKFYLLVKSGTVIKKGAELFVKFQQRNNGVPWSRQGLESLPKGNKDRAREQLEMQQKLQKRQKTVGICIGCQAPAVKACAGCQTPFCGEACRIEHWKVIGCPCKSRGRATRK